MGTVILWSFPLGSIALLWTDAYDTQKEHEVKNKRKKTCHLYDLQDLLFFPSHRQN